MELKHKNAYLCNVQRKLLIVPYGIETYDSLLVEVLTAPLLIVPYGIETIVCKTTWIRWIYF